MIHVHRWFEETRHYQEPPSNLNHHHGSFEGMVAAFYGITVVQLHCVKCNKPKTEILLGRADWLPVPCVEPPEVRLP